GRRRVSRRRVSRYLQWTDAYTRTYSSEAAQPEAGVRMGVEEYALRGSSRQIHAIPEATDFGTPPRVTKSRWKGPQSRPSTRPGINVPCRHLTVEFRDRTALTLFFSVCYGKAGMAAPAGHGD